MSAKKLIVSTYLQYILIVLGALLLFVFVRQLGGVLLFEHWRKSLVTQAPTEAPAAVFSEGEAVVAQGYTKGEV